MISPALCRPTYLADIKTPAVVLPVAPYDETFVVFGEATTAMACFLSGQHRYDIMPATKNDNWQGLAIEQLEVEVDLGSAVDPNHGSAPAGSLLRAGDKLEMVVLGRSSGFARTTKILVAEGLPEGGFNLAVAFTRWSLVKRVGDRVVFKQEIDAGATPSEA